MVKNNLYMVEKNLRSIAKRYKGVKYSLGLAILFLMMGLSAFSQDVMSTEEIAASKENLRSSVGALQNKVEAARKENQKAIDGLKLELIQLMEQGDQVVKSPWMSWQFGANYMYNDWRGTYKGRGDKAEKYPYEGVFTRSENPYERYTSPDSPRHSLLATSSSPYSASTNNRGGLKGYGLEGTKTVKEPIVGFEVSAGINPRVFNAPTVTPLNATQPNLPKAINFIPPQPSVPNITPANVVIQVVDLDSYTNNAGDTVLGRNINVTGSHKTSEGSSLTGRANSKKDNAIVEYTQDGVSSSYSSAGDSVMEVDVTKKRAVTLDPIGLSTNRLEFTNNGTILLTADETGGIEVQTDEYLGGVNDTIGINGATGNIIGNGKRQVGMIFTDEGASTGTYTLQNDGTITMNGEGSLGYGLKVTHNWTAVVINNNTITMKGNKSYGIAVGTNNAGLQPNSSATNNGTINLEGDESGGIAILHDMQGGIKNTANGVINVSGENSFGRFRQHWNICFKWKCDK